MFIKVERLSVKSLSETESGKLVAIISSDLFSIEGGMALCPIILGGPIVTLFTIFFVTAYYKWWYGLVIFCVWIFTLLMQSCAGKYSNELKGKEAACTDERLKFVTDMISGIRTIKCYGWERHYINKVKEVRARQHKYLFWYNVVSGLGLSVFANMGLITVFIIFYIQWYMGEALDVASSVSLLAIIFFVFISIGQFTWLGISAYSVFLAVLRRFAGVLRMEEQSNLALQSRT
jgi:ABC-type multidrug transport system fused ATPase/permease subunit